MPLDMVVEHFNETLFKALAPPLPKLELLQFDGCKKGDKVKLALHQPWGKEIWESEIVREERTTTSWVFVDEGKVLPAYLKHWCHEHRVDIISNALYITDYVQYECKNALMNAIFFPAFNGLMRYRKPIYRRYFKKVRQELTLEASP